jgi:hypothetical protein
MIKVEEFAWIIRAEVRMNAWSSEKMKWGIKVYLEQRDDANGSMTEYMEL